MEIAKRIALSMARPGALHVRPFGVDQIQIYYDLAQKFGDADDQAQAQSRFSQASKAESPLPFFADIELQTQASLTQDNK